MNKLPTEILYKIIDIDVYDNYNLYINRQKDLFELFNLVKPQKYFKNIMFDVLIDIKEKFTCIDCDKFEPFNKYYKFEDEYVLCGKCYVDNIRHNYEVCYLKPVLKELLTKSCEVCYLWKPFSICKRCRKLELLLPLIKECENLAIRNKHSWITTHTRYKKFIDKIITERNFDGELVGFMIILFDFKVYTIYFTCVDKKYRNKGLLKKNDM